MIPVRVDPKVRATVIRSRFALSEDHFLFDQLCPVCDETLGTGLVSLVYVGRQEPGWTAAAVAVHDLCTDAPATHDD